MKLQINEALFDAGGITATLGEDEVEALQVSIELQRRLVIGAVGQADEILHTLPSSDADFIGYDPLFFMRRAGPNDQGEYQETWTSGQVHGMAMATYLAAKTNHFYSYRPDPGVAHPVLGTVVAIMGAGDEEAADKVVADYVAAERYNPLQDTEAADSPGRRALLGFEAARAALWDATNYMGAAAIVDAHNHAQLAA